MTIPAAEPRSLLRRLYDWCVEAAHKPRALWTMSGVAFAESSFFPVPPDVMLIPMALARPDRAYVMEIGRIRIQGKAQDLLENEEVKKAYLGQNLVKTRL